MRRTTLTTIAAAALTLAALAPTGGSAAPTAAASAAPGGAVHAVQYWGTAPQPWDGGDWERRQRWREWRAWRDEARIAEAARREAWRIEREREERRAWWRAQQRYGGYGPGYGRGW